MRILPRILIPSLGLMLIAHPSAQQTPASAIVIRGVTLIDRTGRPALANANVLVEGARITQVSTQPVTAPAGSQVIEGRGKFLIPGLIDVHVHLNGGGNRASTQPMTPQQEKTGTSALHSFLYAGVTTIFDAGNQGSFIFALRDKERAHQLVGQRIFATGACSGPAGRCRVPAGTAGRSTSSRGRGIARCSTRIWPASPTS